MQYRGDIPVEERDQFMTQLRAEVKKRWGLITRVAKKMNHTNNWITDVLRKKMYVDDVVEACLIEIKLYDEEQKEKFNQRQKALKNLQNKVA